MNKDMINIDDFVREKLGGQPEREDPSAWLRMKALLDKEMPERAVPFYFRWGKPMAFLGAALLLSGLCVGGFEITKAIRAKNEGKVVINNVKNTEVSGATSSSSPTLSHSTSDNHFSNSNQPDITASNEEKSNLNKHNTKTISTNSNSFDNIQPKKEVVTNSIVNSNSAVASSLSVKPIVAKKSFNKTSSATQFAEENRTSARRNNSSVIVENKTSSVAKTTTPQSTINSDKNKVTKSNSGESIVAIEKDKISNSTKAQNHKDASGSKTVAALNNLNTVSKADKENRPITEQLKSSKADQNKTANAHNSKMVIAEKDNSKDSIPYTNIVQKETLSKKFPRRIATLIDTQGRGKIALPGVAEPDLLVENKEPIVATNQEIKSGNQAKKESEFSSSASQNSSAALKETSTPKESPIVAKDSKKSKGKSFWEMLNLPGAAANAKKDLRNAQFYAGFSGGINYSLSKTNNFQGVQFGPTGELVFNKNWSLFGAIRYFNRSGGKKTINDSYSKEVSSGIIDSTKGANHFFTVLTDSADRYFNFSTVHSFELPVTVRYMINKLYLMTGINLAYSLPVNVELVQKEYKNLNPHAISTNTTKPILRESAPILATSDFGSRFGIGYILGAGYQITPAWQADLRIVNTFWDNSKGNGANKLSKDFYKLPSVQISVGYQFNRSRAKPTFGPTTTSP